MDDKRCLTKNRPHLMQNGWTVKVDSLRKVLNRISAKVSKEDLVRALLDLVEGYLMGPYVPLMTENM